MQQKKLTTRIIIVALVLLLAMYYLYPTFRYENLVNSEEEEAGWIARQMGVSYAFVIESLNQDESIIWDRLAEIEGIPTEQREIISERIKYLQNDLRVDLIKYRKKAIKRGLDLQGGMHLVLEVDLVQLMLNLARQRDGKLEKILGDIQVELDINPRADFNETVVNAFEAEGVKLSQYFGEAGESNTTVLAYLSDQAEDAINRSLEILRNRIDQFGVSEPSITKQGARRIVLELPGVQDPKRARDLIGRTALLEFKLLSDPQKTPDFIKAVDALIAKRSHKADGDEEQDSIATELSVTDEVEESVPADTTETFDLAVEMGGEPAETDTTVALESEESPFGSLLRSFRGDVAVPAENLREVKSILSESAVQKLIPEGSQILWGAKPEIAGNGVEYSLFYIVKAEPELIGDALTDAQVDISGGYNNPGTAGQPIVSLTMNRKGARKFARVTGANIDKRLAIVMDKKVYMAPNIRGKIPNGRAIIEGTADVEEANDLAIVLRAGALPTTVVIEEERTVGPSLGRDSIRKGTMSAIIGMILVVVFMVFYYGLSGIIANVALLMNIGLIFAGLAFFGSMGIGAALSLPGIAGIILTIGMAVDANVLIFERIREELATGKTVWHAISAGYERAFRTILDANITTLIAALVLLQFGTGPIKGFAVTLSIGIVCSLFTAIVVTRLIFDYFTSSRSLAKLSI